jgi:hypothetical protein
MYKFLKEQQIKFSEIIEIHKAISYIIKNPKNIIDLRSEKRAEIFLDFYKNKRNFNIRKFDKKKIMCSKIIINEIIKHFSSLFHVFILKYKKYLFLILIKLLKIVKIIFDENINVQNLIETINQCNSIVSFNQHFSSVWNYTKLLPDKRFLNKSRIPYLLKNIKELLFQLNNSITFLSELNLGCVIELNNYQYQLNRNPENLFFLVEFLNYLIKKIENKELCSIKEFRYIFSNLKYDGNFRSDLKKILGYDLILFNITKEPFAHKDLNDRIIDDLRECLIEKFEAEKKIFICNVLTKNNLPETIWNYKIKAYIWGNIKRNFINERTDFGISEHQAIIEYNQIKNNQKLQKLLSYTLFSNIRNIISDNWDTDFKVYYSNNFTKEYFNNNFKKLTKVRNKIPHPELEKIDILDFLSKRNTTLSNILDFLFELELVIRNAKSSFV